MAAAAAAIQNYLENTLLIPEAARDALVAEGLDNLAEVGNFTDKDITEMCENCKQPGGTIPNPAYHAANNPNVATHIRNHGTHIGYSAFTRLRKLRYYCYALQRVGRPFVAQAATLAVLNQWWNRYTYEDEYSTEPDMPEKLEKVEKVRQAIENMVAYLREKHGGHNAPLSYIIREDTDVPDHADDEPFGHRYPHG